MSRSITFLAFWKKISILAGVLAVLQILINYILYNNMPEMKIYLGHFFIYAITALGYYLYVSVYKKLPAHAGYVFGAIGMGKMIFSIIFLLPIIFKPYDGRVYFVLQFMTIYMVYLLIEVLTLLKNMKQNE